MFHTAVLCRFNSVISSLTVFWEKKRLGRNEVWCEHRNPLLYRSIDLSCCKIQRTGFSKKNEPISLRGTKLQPSHKYSTHNQLLFPVHSIVHCGHHLQHGHQCDDRVLPRHVSAYEDPLSWLLLLFETKLSFFKNSTFKWSLAHSMAMLENWSNASWNRFIPFENPYTF